MANEGTVKASIATDESLTSGHIRRSRRSRVPLCIALSTSSLLFLPALLAAVTDSVAASLVTVTTVGPANCDIKATPGRRESQRQALLTQAARLCLLEAKVCYSSSADDRNMTTRSAPS